jgi:hypothetical protein
MQEANYCAEQPHWHLVADAEPMISLTYLFDEWQEPHVLAY